MCMRRRLHIGDLGDKSEHVFEGVGGLKLARLCLLIVNSVMGVFALQHHGW